MARRIYSFSQHYQEDKTIDTGLAISCVNTGKRELDQEPNKYKARKIYERGELIVIYRDLGDRIHVITAFWNQKGRQDEFRR